MHIYRTDEYRASACLLKYLSNLFCMFRTPSIYDRIQKVYHLNLQQISIQSVCLIIKIMYLDHHDNVT